MGQLYKGDVTVWFNVPTGSDIEPAELLDRFMFAMGTAAAIKGVSMFPENAKNVEPTTIDEWAKVAKAEAALVATDDEDAERFNVLIDTGVSLVNERAQAATV